MSLDAQALENLVKRYLDTVAVGDVIRFEAEFLDFVRSRHANLLADIRESKKLSDDTTEALNAAVADFKKGFSGTETAAPVVEDKSLPAEPVTVEKEHVTVHKSADQV